MPCDGDSVKSHNRNWFGRSGILYSLTTMIKHGFYPTKGFARQNCVSHSQNTVLNQQCGEDSACFVPLCINDSSNYSPVGIRLNFHVIRYQQDCLQQVLETCGFFRGHGHDDRVPVPFIRDKANLCQLLFDPVWVCIGLINFIQRYDDRSTGSFCMGCCLSGLRHNPIVCSNDQDDDICSLGTTRSHRSKCCMTRGVKEGDFLFVMFDLICGDVLGDPTCLTTCYIRVPDCIKQGCFSMIYMTKNRHDWRASNQLI